jgi:hypothetical protein
VLTPVGYRCKDCVRAQQKVFYADFRRVHYLVAAVVALPLALVAGWLVPRLGWPAIILGPLAGLGIARAVHWAIQRRRGPYTWLVVCACIVVGALPQLLGSLFALLGLAVDPAGAVFYAGGLMRLVWTIIYTVAATGAAYAAVRPGQRV